MTIRQYFLDDVEDNRHEYDMQDFSRFHALVFGGNGFSNKEDTDNMKYEVTDNMNGKVGSGYVTYNGYVMELTEPETLQHEIADPDHARIDIVVARFKFDPEQAKFTVDILKGSPGSSPKKPGLTQNSSTYEIPIAEVKVNADESSLKEANVTDMREGNYLPIDNLQRGVQVNENGLVTMPNQSFVKATNWDEYQYPGERDAIPFGEVEKDNQNEMQSDNYTFIPKEDGIYHFWVEMAWDESLDNIGYRMYLYKNDRESFPLGARWATDKRDRFFICSGLDSVEKGDKITFRLSIAGLSGRTLPPTWFTRIRVAKMA